MRIPKFLIILFLFLFLCCFSSCSLKSKTNHSVEYYTLAYAPPAVEPRPMLPVTLSLEKFKTASPYNSHRIFYRKDTFLQNKYHYHQWVSAPDEMIIHLLSRDLIASNLFQAVLVSGDVMTNHQVIGMVEEFYEQDTDNHWNAVLSLTVTLIKNDETNETKRFQFQKNYKQIYPLDQNNPKGLSQALSRAMSEISGQVISDIYKTLQQAED